jgi:2'-5' RNA ligase
MRTFVGIKVCSDALLKIQEDLRRCYPAANHTLPGNIHLTLVFLGELSESQARDVVNILKRLRYPSFQIEINKIKNLRDMIIAEVKPAGELMVLQELLMRDLAALNLQLEKRRYYPHITLTRKAETELMMTVQIPLTVREVTLFVSERRNQVLTYTPIFIAKLQEPDR